MTLTQLTERFGVETSCFGMFLSICCHRNPDHHQRPRFDEVFESLGRPELIPSSFGEELDLESVPPAALVLGSPLDAAKHLYLDLQHTYTQRRK